MKTFPGFQGVLLSVFLLFLAGPGLPLGAQGLDDGEHGGASSEESGAPSEDLDDEAVGSERESEALEVDLSSESFAGTEIGEGVLESVPGFDARSAEKEGFEESGESTESDLEAYESLKSLPSIESLLFSSPETVCDRDERVRISPTVAIPWRWNCELIITLRDGRKARGTGWFIGPCTVMTAGHVVHSGGSGGSWMKSIEVIPGMNGALRPFGSTVATRFRSVNGWVKSGKPEYDYGAIILNTRLGDRVGWYGFAALSDSSLNKLLVNTAGYPGDKPFGTQWYMAGRISKVEPRRLQYMIDTYGGQSGSAVYRLLSGQRHAVGIHAYGGCPNKATRITKPVFNNMITWKNECR